MVEVYCNGSEPFQLLYSGVLADKEILATGFIKSFSETFDTGRFLVDARAIITMKKYSSFSLWV